jgi:hypothetical protein
VYLVTGKRGILSVGKDRHQFPRSSWGWLDHVRLERLEQASPGLRKPDRYEPLPTPGRPAPVIPSVRSDEERKARERRRREIDELLQGAGIRRRPWSKVDDCTRVRNAAPEGAEEVRVARGVGTCSLFEVR